MYGLTPNKAMVKVSEVRKLWIPYLASGVLQDNHVCLMTTTLMRNPYKLFWGPICVVFGNPYVLFWGPIGVVFGTITGYFGDP